MGRALYTIAGFVVAPGAGGLAPTFVTGTTAQIPNCPFDKKVEMLATWVDSQAAGFLRVTSPRLHDAQNGLQFVHAPSQVLPLNAIGLKQRMIPQDLLTILFSGSATAGDVESFAIMFHFEDLPGVSQRFIGVSQLQKEGVNLASLRATLALGTAGGISGEEAMNTDQGHLKANTDYAVLGATFDNECLMVNFRGPDTGNLRIPIPGDDTARDYTARWFVTLSEKLGMDLIPVINWANAPATFLDGVQDENGADPQFSLQLVELPPGVVPPAR